MQFLFVWLFHALWKLHGGWAGLRVANLYENVPGTHHAVHTGTEVGVRGLDGAPDLRPLRLQEVNNILEE